MGGLLDHKVFQPILLRITPDTHGHMGHINREPSQQTKPAWEKMKAEAGTKRKPDLGGDYHVCM